MKTEKEIKEWWKNLPYDSKNDLRDFYHKIDKSVSILEVESKQMKKKALILNHPDWDYKLFITFANCKGNKQALRMGRY